MTSAPTWQIKNGRLYAGMSNNGSNKLRCNVPTTIYDYLGDVADDALTPYRDRGDIVREALFDWIQKTASPSSEVAQTTKVLARLNKVTAQRHFQEASEGLTEECRMMLNRARTSASQAEAIRYAEEALADITDPEYKALLQQYIDDAKHARMYIVNGPRS